MLIKLKRDGYDEYLDYLKGMSIIMVLINHGAQNIVDMALFPIWIYEAVPMFLLIQVFHAYKKRTVQNPSIKKIWERILRPFVYTQIVFIAYCFYAFIKRGISIDEYFLDMIKSGGNGQGAYFIWIYIQFAFLLPICFKIVKKKYALPILIAVSAIFEIFCSLINIPDNLYRLLCFRYIFLIYLGYLWSKRGIVLNKKTFVLSCISIISIIFLHYGFKYRLYSNLEPLVFDSGWRTYHWFTYFLPWALLPCLIYLAYRRMNNKINQIIILTGKHSYEIFLFQMIVFGLSPINNYINIIICFLPLLYFEYNNIKKILQSKS